MTAQDPATEKTSLRYAVALVPVLAFGGTIAGIALHNAGVQFEIQYAAAGGFFASCLLAYLAWIQVRRDIVALSTPIYGFIFLITPIDYTGGIALQLVYAAGLTILAARLRSRFTDPGNLPGATGSGSLGSYLDAAASAFGSLGPASGHRAADAFLWFSAGDYRRAADHARAAAGIDGMSPALVRGFSILRQHAELLDRNEERPFTFLTFLPEDAAILALPLAPGDSPEKEFEAMLDNALLLLFAAGWHASPADREALEASRGFAERLLGSRNA